jgi:hypothetical protein
MDHRAKQRLSLLTSFNTKPYLDAVCLAHLKPSPNYPAVPPFVFCDWDCASDNIVKTIRKNLGERNLKEFLRVEKEHSYKQTTGFVFLSQWRLSQSIYRFDPDLYRILTETPLDNVPTDVLQALPDWCLYIETPGLFSPINGEQFHGFWVKNDWYDNKHTLTFMVDIGEVGDVLGHTPFMLGDNIIDSLENANNLQFKAAEDWSSRQKESWQKFSPHVFPIFLNLVLYLCANPELTIDGAPAEIPRPVMPSKAAKLFPAQHATLRDVGITTGDVIREHPDVYALTGHGKTFFLNPPPKPARWEITQDDNGKNQLRWVPPEWQG